MVFITPGGERRRDCNSTQISTRKSLKQLWIDDLVQEQGTRAVDVTDSFPLSNYYDCLVILQDELVLEWEGENTESENDSTSSVVLKPCIKNQDKKGLLYQLSDYVSEEFLARQCMVTADTVYLIYEELNVINDKVDSGSTTAMQK